MIKLRNLHLFVSFILQYLYVYQNYGISSSVLNLLLLVNRNKYFPFPENFKLIIFFHSLSNQLLFLRLLQHSGVYPDYTKEPSSLASRRPNVKSVTLLLEKWWGSGIVHAKVWISDNRDVYIGSANNDWKSLTQV